MALFGIHLWTVATVVLALAVAIWRPAVAASLAPLAMVAAGISGLVAAAGVPGSPVNWLVNSRVSFRGKPGSGPFPPPPGASAQVRFPLPPGVKTQFSTAKAGNQVLAPPGVVRKIIGTHGQVITPKGAVRQIITPKGAVRQVITPKGAVMRRPQAHLLGWWDGRCSFRWRSCCSPWASGSLRGRWPGWRTVPRPRRSGCASTCGRTAGASLLVPVSLIGLTVFGVWPWTVGMVIAAVVVVMKWPKVAADLVPVALAAFALYGFEIAARWQSGRVRSRVPARSS